jgi:hypothetical protein
MHRRVGLLPQKSKPIFLFDLGLRTHRFEKDLYQVEKRRRKKKRQSHQRRRVT